MQNDSSEVSFCPSFNSYSFNNRLVDIAAEVSRDSKNDDVLNGEEFEFQFVSLQENPEETSTAFPIFNRHLLLNGDNDDDVEEAIRIPLRNLFIGDGDIPSSSSSSSSSEADELEGVPAGTYCVWSPKQSAESSPNRCEKSRSTGSCSRRWRLNLKDLLKRSYSDGKVSSSRSFSFLNFEKNSAEKKHEEKVSEKTATAKKKNEGKVEVKARKAKRGGKVSSAHEDFYVRNKAGDKRRSTNLPYRQDLVGIFANVSRTFPPF